MLSAPNARSLYKCCKRREIGVLQPNHFTSSAEQLIQLGHFSAFPFDLDGYLNNAAPTKS